MSNVYMYSREVRKHMDRLYAMYLAGVPTRVIKETLVEEGVLPSGISTKTLSAYIRGRGCTVTRKSGSAA